MTPRDRDDIDILRTPCLLSEAYQLTRCVTTIREAGALENGTDDILIKQQEAGSEHKTSTGRRGLFSSLERLANWFGRDEEMDEDLLSVPWDTTMKLDEETIYLKRSPAQHNILVFGPGAPYTLRKGYRMSHHLQNNALPLLVCRIAEDDNDDTLTPIFHVRHGAENKQSRWDSLIQQLLKEDAATVSVVGHPDKRNGRGEQHFHAGPIQVLIVGKTEGWFDEESEKFSYIRGKRQQIWRNSLTDGCRVVDVWRPENEAVFTSGQSSRQLKIQPQESKSCQEQDQHTAEQLVTDPDDSHGDEDDKDYFARMTEAYRKNFCEEAADLFIRTMEAGRWADIVRQLNFTKARADQLFEDSVSTLKQKAGEAYDSHPHHSSPPESLFRVQELLVREAVLTLAQNCRQENVISPQFFEKK
ncbi:PREDICTED: uncharacterized protein LOC109479937 isoform X2 [Branchiostoma belcheri]|nr:PREDICTED: uncharacterized protein LOC109479937 isoform X2 [Branchiostoma belcheri]